MTFPDAVNRFFDLAKRRGYSEEAAFALAVVDMARALHFSYEELVEAARTYHARTGDGAAYATVAERLNDDLNYRAEMEQEHAKLMNRQN